MARKRRRRRKVTSFAEAIRAAGDAKARLDRIAFQPFAMDKKGRMSSASEMLALKRRAQKDYERAIREVANFAAPKEVRVRRIT